MRLLAFLFAISISLSSCEEESKTDGLWELHYVDLDMVPKHFKPTFLQISTDGSFSASQESGDAIGIYDQSGSIISFRSEDKNWFNKRWKVKRSGDELLLWDLENEFRAEQLRFKKIDAFPSFEDFQHATLGKWQLYKREERGKTQQVAETFITIGQESYSILEKDSVIERGKVLLDARHQKIMFENSLSTWDIRIVWDQLRITEKSKGITYRLRKN